MSLPHAILGVLADGPRHGRAVARALAHLLDGIRPANPGQVYATLGRLTRRGMVVARPARGARAAHGAAYALAPAGRAALRRWLGTAGVAAEAPCGFVERLVVLHALGNADGLARLLAVRRAQLTALRDALASPRRGHRTHDRLPTPDAAAAPLAPLVREAALDLLAAELAWLDDAREKLLGARARAPKT
jgi:DNA-binding PadR family transcriptional regulator